MPKNFRSKGNQRRRPMSAGNGPNIAHPPQFSSTKRFSGRARYLATGSVTSITRGMLLNHLIMNTASGTANYRLLSAFRLKSVEGWCSTATLGSTSQVSVEWTSTNGPSVVASDTSIGTAQPCHVLTRPPSQSLAGFWSLTGVNESEVLFIVGCSANAILDITYDAVIQNGETPVLATTTASGAVGTVYMTYLGGVTTTTFQPVSYASLT